MERLIYSSSVVPSKPHLKSYPNLTRSPHLETRKLGFLLPTASPSTTVAYSEPIRLNPLSTLRLRPQTHCFAKLADNSILGPTHPSSSLAQRGNGSFPDFRSTAETGPFIQKAFTTGKTILLATLATVLIQPILTTSPALATFQTATKTATEGGRGLLRTGILSSAWTGFLAGCLHTLSGPDHLAALAPLAIGRTRLESAAVGALWGCGHDAGQLIFGLLFLLLKDRLHIEVIKTWGTVVVGVTLFIIGAMGIKEVSEAAPAPCVALGNGECDVSVYESFGNEELVGVKNKKKVGLATFATGIVHGLQPDALMMVLPALALPSRVAGAAFLCMFLGGTVVSMGGYTLFLGSCNQALKERVPRITEKLTWASSLVAIGLGLAILVSQFLGYSLY